MLLELVQELTNLIESWEEDSRWHCCFARGRSGYWENKLVDAGFIKHFKNLKKVFILAEESLFQLKIRSERLQSTVEDSTLCLQHLLKILFKR